MVDRRRFLTTGLTGLAGLGVAQRLSAGQGLIPAPEVPAAKSFTPPARILRRTLGRTGLKLPVVSMGVMNADNPNLVRAALEAGIVHFDTAHGYQRGRNEEMLGQVFKGVKREAFVIATKVVGEGMDRVTGRFSAETRPEAFIQAFELSLQRLQLAHVDILYLHNIRCREAALFEPLLKVLLRLKKEGRTRFIGVTTHRNEPDVIRAAVESGAYDVVLTSYNFLQANREEVRLACREAAKAGIGVVAMKTQAGVFFDKEKTKPIDMKAALKWALQDECVCTAIPGFTTFDQLAEDLPVMGDIRLSAQERAILESGTPQASLFCQQCGACQPQCPKGLPIPSLMRSYMYASAYRNLLHAKDLVTSLDLEGAPCGDCGACTVRCPHGLDVRPRIEDVAGLRGLDDRFLA